MSVYLEMPSANFTYDHYLFIRGLGISIHLVLSPRHGGADGLKLASLGDVLHVLFHQNHPGTKTIGLGSAPNQASFIHSAA
ncbi:hypothetical protein M7I_4345 [Glarea lozoyensis 74030]|uniref:Uncharacterized protein n=1 Tax=Glarea lozoyensis (strain ATCC 74030 / MF5533) TaxID=1104152 RepID=H0ENY0_GLAL7|nr:hypothetical protein M7I_4345 [Glarea lozoyensis 74030]